MRTHLRVACLATLLTGSAVALQGRCAGRILTVEYQAGEVVSLQGTIGFALDLEFQSDERVVNVASGNLLALDLGAENNHLIIKPRSGASATNIIVLTNRRSYHFDYQIVSAPGVSDGIVVQGVRFRFPAVDAAPPGEKRPTRWNANYWYCGAPELRPEEVFDDGIRTYIRLPKRSILPVVYAAANNGAERLVNSHSVDDWLIVHEKTARLVLKHANLFGCVTDRNPERSRDSSTALQFDTAPRN